MKKKLLAGLLIYSLCFPITKVLAGGDIVVGKITIQGNVKLSDDTIKHKMVTKENDVFDPVKIRKDIEIIYNTGYFKDIKVNSENFEGKLFLTFILKEKPSIRQIVIEGNSEIEESDIRDVITVTTGSIYQEKEVEKVIQAIKKLYQDEGFYIAEIKAKTVRVSDAWTKLKFVIKEHEEILISKIVFQGNKDFSDDDLKSVIETSEEWIFSWLTSSGTLKKDVIDKDISRLMVFYLDNGYIDIQVGNPKVEVNADKKGLTVTIPISEGIKYNIGNIKFEGNRIFPTEQLREKLEMEKGDVFSKEKLRKTIDGISNMYGKEGYLNTVVYPDIRDRKENTVNLLLRINEGEIVHLHEVLISGNTRTRDKIIRRQVPVGEGGILSQKVIKDAKANLKRLGFFKDVSLTPKPTKTGVQNEVDLDIKVEERMTGTFSLGAGWSNVNQMMGTFSISESNFRGTGRKVSVSATLGGRTQQYNIGLRDQYFLDTPFFASFNSYFKRQNRVNFRPFNTDRKGGDITVGYPITDEETNNKYTRAFLKYKYVIINVFDVSEESSEYVKLREGESTTSSVTISIQRDSRNDFFHPTAGTLSKLSIERSGGILGGSNYFTRVLASTAWHFPTGLWKIAFHARASGGYLLPTGERKLDDISFDELFRLGGNNSIRGFKWGEIGPRDNNSVSIGGDKYVFFNLEFDVPIVGQFRLAVFSDIGNLWRTYGQDEKDNTDFDITDLRQTVGFGVRFLSPMGPIRLDYGVKLDQREGESMGNFHFAMGSMF